MIRQVNYPLILITAIAIGAIGGAVGNVIKEHDVWKSTQGGVATGVIAVTLGYLWHVIVGFPLPY